MNLIIAASSGGVTDILRETAETFGWNWKLFLSQVISFCIVAYPFATLRLQTNPCCARGASAQDRGRPA